MRIIADFHIHSKYSRSCSRDLTLENIAKWCEYKGIGLVGTADFTHPAWLADIKSKLEPAEPGLYRLKDGSSPTRFILSTEISCIYSQGGKTRRVHVCLLMPSIASVDKLVENLDKRGCNLRSDGRPILGISAKELARIVLEIDSQSMVIPAHVWTPWFAVFGSKSGFDSMEECFEELAPEIFAAETGLSSDPPMNWRLSALDHISLVSNSDAHSPANLGREANVFEIPETELSFGEIRRILKEKDLSRFLYTIEFFPEEGKYHVDGHAACGFSCDPNDCVDGVCPVCGKSLVLGVLRRVQELADRDTPKADSQVPYRSVIPLQEIIADVLSVGKNSKKVMSLYMEIVAKRREFEVLLDLDKAELEQLMPKNVAAAVMAVREGRVEIVPGYDGVYGKIDIIGVEKIAGRQKKLV